MLSEAEKLDLRRRVLAGHELTIEQAAEVFETLRAAQGGAVLSQEETKKSRKGKKQGISDEQLEADLNDLGL